MISVPGVGSGLDVESIVTGLVAAEGDPKTLLLSNKRSDTQLEISAFGGLKNILTTSFTSPLGFLKNNNNYQLNSLSSSDPTIFTATSSTGSIAPGRFSIEVRDLAEAQKLITTGFSGENTDVGSGTLSIAVGTSSFDVSIDSSNQTLTGIRNAINNATDNTGVSATIINVDDGANGTEAKLILSSDKTGTANAITVTVNDDDGNDTDAAGLSAFYYDTSDATIPERLTEIAEAKDAEVYIDGQRVLSASNTVDNAIQGVTIIALKEDAGTTYELTVARDTETVASNVQSFVSAYNQVINYVGDVTFFDPQNGDAGILLGDSTLRTFTNQIRSEISNTVTGVNSSFTSLVDIGITSNDDGTLVVDNNRLNTALSTNLNDVADLFSSDNGIATRLDNIVNEYVKTNGLIDGKTEGLTETINDINTDLTDLQRQLDSLEERLRTQFTALDLVVTQLNATSTFLTQQFDILSDLFRPRSN